MQRPIPSPESAATAASPWPLLPRSLPVAIALLWALTFLTQAGAFGAWFVGDDFDFLRFLRELDRPFEVFGFDFWGEWEPLWYLSWYLDMQLWGLFAPGFHLTNTCLLAAVVSAIFVLLRTLRPNSPATAWTAALLFLVHPVHDEAVTYLAARGHPMALALALAALALWARFRTTAHPAGRRGLPLAALALTVAFLAGLAKEIALTLPAWAWGLEWAIERPAGRLRRLVAACAAAALFALPAAAVMFARYGAVGLDSDKIDHALNDPLEVLDNALDDAPRYALLGALPVPFAFVDFPTLERARPLGWMLVLAGAGGWAAAAFCSRRGGGPPPVDVTLYGLGLILVATALLPVFWADLPVRRRYAFVPSAGMVLVAALWLDWLRVRSRQLAAGLLAGMLLLGIVGTERRNALYRRSGEVTRSLVETARELRRQEEPAPEGEDPVALTTLPRSWGGDFLSGAYLLHHTDLVSALRVAGIDQRRAQYALSCFHADDYVARAWLEPDGSVGLEVGFRDAARFQAAQASQADEQGRGDLVRVRLVGQNAETRTLRYVLQLSRHDGLHLLVYGEGRFRTLHRHEAATVTGGGATW